MFSASTETYVAWVALLLVLAFGLSIVSGIFALARSRRERYFQVRREAVLPQRRPLAIVTAVRRG